MRYKTDIKRICHLAWPAIIQEAMNTVVTYVDTAMVGAMGATASAAVGLTSSVTWLLGSISVAFGVKWSKGNKKRCINLFLYCFFTFYF